MLQSLTFEEAMDFEGRIYHPDNSWESNPQMSGETVPTHTMPAKEQRYEESHHAKPRRPKGGETIRGRY